MSENTPPVNDEPANPSVPHPLETGSPSPSPIELPPNPPAPPNQPPMLPSATLRRQINEAANGEEVRRKLVLHLSVKEVDKRVNALTNVLEKVEFNEKERKKIKPKPAGFTFDEVTGAKKPAGQPVYDEAQVNQLEKLNREYGKLQGAITLAIDHNDFSRVMNLANGNKEEGEGG